MTNEMKLLRAFIQASGYEIEEVKTVTKKKFSFLKALFTDRYNQQRDITTIDYKVTKKPDPLDKMYDGVTLDQLTRNIFELNDHQEKYRWISYTTNQYDAVVNWFGKSVKNKTEFSCVILGVRMQVND